MASPLNNSSVESKIGTPKFDVLEHRHRSKLEQLISCLERKSVRIAPDMKWLHRRTAPVGIKDWKTHRLWMCESHQQNMTCVKIRCGVRMLALRSQRKLTVPSTEGPVTSVTNHSQNSDRSVLITRPPGVFLLLDPLSFVTPTSSDHYASVGDCFS